MLVLSFIAYLYRKQHICIWGGGVAHKYIYIQGERRRDALTDRLKAINIHVTPTESKPDADCVRRETNQGRQIGS